MKGLILDFTAESPPRPPPPSAPRPAVTLRLEDLRLGGPWTTLARLRSRRFERCIVLVNDLRLQSRWISILGLAMLASADERTIVDRRGEERPLTLSSFARREVPFAVRRAWTDATVRRKATRALRRVPRAGRPKPSRPRHLAFVRSDLGPPLVAGGSLAHIRGVVDGLKHHGCDVSLVTPAPVAGFADDGRVHVLPPDERFQLSVELPHLAYNLTTLPRLVEILQKVEVDAVYHRLALGYFAAASAARTLDLPLIVEYNGPEAWIARNWGAARRHLDWFEEAERRVLRAADLVVAVSEPLRDLLLKAGVPEERILINPNAVDAARFDPDRLRPRREAVRRALGVAPSQILVGFTGTFGPWHGAEVLARAACAVPEPWAGPMRYLFVGDGPRRARTEAILEEGGRKASATFTGLVPPDEIPDLLSACDLCASPHVPNPDGSAFFGSPTKLFEYLASGRAVVASGLGQIAEILDHGRNAWLVPPGDVGALVDGLTALAADPDLRHRLGDAGRRDAVARHSWTAHVERILDRLARPSPASDGR